MSITIAQWRLIELLKLSLGPRYYKMSKFVRTIAFMEIVDGKMEYISLYEYVCYKRSVKKTVLYDDIILEWFLMSVAFG